MPASTRANPFHSRFDNPDGNILAAPLTAVGDVHL
jgi:hypothetical protein